MSSAEQIKGRVTAADVARAAGVSRQTVSHILNGRIAKFPATTQASVLAASRELGYRPSVAGRALRNGRSDIVVVVLPNMTIGHNFQDGIDLVAEQVEALGGSVMTRFAGRSVGSTLEAVLYVQPMGVVDFGGLSDDERRALEDVGISVVPSSRTRELRTGPLPDEAIGEVQVQALTSSDQRAIVFAGLQDSRGESPSSRGRREGVEAACHRRGISFLPPLSIPLEVAGAANELKRVLGHGPIGIACYNDDVATAVLAGCKALGARVPEDAAIIGVDHTPLGQLTSPPLTTVVLNVEAEVSQSLSELRALLRGEQWTPHDVDDEATLVQGGTV